MKHDLKAKNILKSAMLYCTKPRNDILKVLIVAKTPLTQKQITEKLGKNQHNKTTIYRTLRTLAKKDLVHKAYIHKKASHFELAENCGKTRCHPHFTCSNCGKTICLTDISMPLIKGLKKGFVLQRQKLQLLGLCPDCSS